MCMIVITRIKSKMQQAFVIAFILDRFQCMLKTDDAGEVFGADAYLCFTQPLQCAVTDVELFRQFIYSDLPVTGINSMSDVDNGIIFSGKPGGKKMVQPAHPLRIPVKQGYDRVCRKFNQFICQLEQRQGIKCSKPAGFKTDADQVTV